MPNLYIIVITAVFFAFCTAVLLYQALYSVYFRKKIASEHSFTEGIMTGITYPMLWVSYGLIAVQLVSFIAFQNSSELILALRLLIFAASVIAFCVFKSLTPPLLALWFGKTAFWDTKGEVGKHPFTNIYSVKVHKKKSSTVINNQQLYKLTFYVKGKTFLLIPKKYSCKMTAKQISVLTNYVDFKESKKPEISKKALLYSVCLPVLVLLITVCIFMQAVSSGILNPVKYSAESDKLTAPSTSKIETISKITDVVTDGERLFVFYGDIGAINTYDTSGKFLFSVSLPHSIFKSTDVAFENGELLYKFGNELIRYSPDGLFVSKEAFASEHASLFDSGSVKIGEQKVSFDSSGVHLGNNTVVTRAGYYSMFEPAIIWPLNMLFIIALFALRFYVMSDQKKDN